MKRSVLLWCLLGFALGNLFQIAIRPGTPVNSLSGAPLAAPNLRGDDQWRWAADQETYDVYVKIPCPWQVCQRDPKNPCDDCERGIAPWRLGPDGKEKKDRNIEWVRVHRGEQALWMPARSDLDPARIVVFDGFEAHMAPVPASGKNLGTIVVKEHR